MKLIKCIAVAGLVLTLNLQALAQETKPNFAYKPKSEKAAQGWSSYGFLAPIGAGVAIWVVQKGKKINMIGKRWVGPGLYDFVEEPFTFTENPNRALPLALIASGVVIGPSVGYFYGGCTEKGFISIGKRIGIIGGTFLLGYTPLTDASGGSYLHGVMLLSAGVFTIASAYHDIAVVDDTVRKHNASLANISIAPTYISSAGAPGVELTIRF